MQYKTIGTTNIKTPPIVFGGNVFGWTLDKKESFEILDKIFDKGFTFIDTADVYSRWADGNDGGESEKIIGEWMKSRGNRQEVAIATKVGSSMQQGGDKNISKNYILKAVEDSLQRLKTDYIDLYFTHWDDNKTPVEETLSAYQKLIEQGKVRHIGASNLSPERLQASLDAAKKDGLPKYEVFQPEYNLLERDKFEGKIKDICVKNNLGVTSYFSLASGFLTGKYRQESDFEGKKRKDFVEKYLNRRGLEVLDTLDQISEKHNVSNAAVALAWTMEKPGITAPIASATKQSHLKAFTDAASLELSEQEMGVLDQISKK